MLAVEQPKITFYLFFFGLENNKYSWAYFGNKNVWFSFKNIYHEILPASNSMKLKSIAFLAHVFFFFLDTIHWKSDGLGRECDESLKENKLCIVTGIILYL